MTQFSEKNLSQQERLARQTANNKRLGLILLSVVVVFFLGIMVKRLLLA